MTIARAPGQRFEQKESALLLHYTCNPKCGLADMQSMGRARGRPRHSPASTSTCSHSGGAQAVSKLLTCTCITARRGQTPGPEVWLAGTPCCLFWRFITAMASCQVPDADVSSPPSGEYVCTIHFCTCRSCIVPANLWAQDRHVHCHASTLSPFADHLHCLERLSDHRNLTSVH